MTHNINLIKNYYPRRKLSSDHKYLICIKDYTDANLMRFPQNISQVLVGDVVKIILISVHLWFVKPGNVIDHSITYGRADQHFRFFTNDELNIKDILE